MDRLNWQCCLACSSKTASRILIFSIAMGADYSIELISIENYVPQFIGHDNIFIGSVSSTLENMHSKCLDFPFDLSQIFGRHICIL